MKDIYGFKLYESIGRSSILDWQEMFSFLPENFCLKMPTVHEQISQCFEILHFLQVPVFGLQLSSLLFQNVSGLDLWHTTKQCANRPGASDIFVCVFVLKPNTALSDVIVVLLTVLMKTPWGRLTYRYLIPTNS